MSKESTQVPITLHVIGLIAAERYAPLPVTLAGVKVTLTEVTSDPSYPPKPVSRMTDETGSVDFEVTLEAKYLVDIQVGRNSATMLTSSGDPITIKPDQRTYTRYVTLPDLTLTWALDSDSHGKPVASGVTLPHGKNVFLTVSGCAFLEDNSVIVSLSANGVDAVGMDDGGVRQYRTFTSHSGPWAIRLALGTIPLRGAAADPPTAVLIILLAEPQTVEGNISVGLRRANSRMTEDVPLWVSIRKGTDALGFDRYFDFMNWIFCSDSDRDDPTISRMGSHKGTPPAITRQPKLLGDTARRRFLPFTDTDAYRNIKVATEAFVMANCGVFSNFHEGEADYVQNQVGIPEPVTGPGLTEGLNQYLRSVKAPGVKELLPYLAIIRRKLIDQNIKVKDIGDIVLGADERDTGQCYGLLSDRLTCPCLMELIWCYWQEEGMLVQTMNALTRRFQNIRSPSGNDPLANLETDPLRPLNNVIWGYIQDEQHRLSVVRRNYEYDHHYGLRLAGRAVRDMRTADSRSKFLEAFHTLLSITSAFYKRDDDTTIVADGFSVLNGLKEAHLILSQGAHNQFGDLPSTARIEMLMQQWILSRPEMREFLPTRIMVAYPESWMDRVDAMKKLQGWTDTSVLHFRNLAIFGEQVLLSIRYGAWADVNDPVQGTNWARYWRPEIQGYMHAYRSVTGIDLSADVTNARIDATMPSVHLVHRQVEQQRSA